MSFYSHIYELICVYEGDTMEFLNYFDNVFTVYHIALLVGGTFAGIILGALPGLSPTMSVALLIPSVSYTHLTLPTKA